MFVVNVLNNLSSTFCVKIEFLQILAKMNFANKTLLTIIYFYSDVCGNFSWIIDFYTINN